MAPPYTKPATEQQSASKPTTYTFNGFGKSNAYKPLNTPLTASSSEKANLTTASTTTAPVASTGEAQSNLAMKNYYEHKLADTIEAPNVDATKHMRIWLKQFETLATITGVSEMRTCLPRMLRLLPPTISQWIMSLPVNVQKDWCLLKAALVDRFDIPASEQDAALHEELMDIQQEPDEKIALYAARFETTVSYFNTRPTDKELAILFIKGITNSDVRQAMWTVMFEGSAHVKHAPLMLSGAIKTAISSDQFEWKNERVASASSSERDTPRGESSVRRNDQQRAAAPSHKHRRAYDLDGNPICDICAELHRTIDCPLNDQPAPRRRSRK